MRKTLTHWISIYKTLMMTMMICQQSGLMSYNSTCGFTNESRSLGLMGFAASRNQADARHYDLPYLYNTQQVAVVLAIQAIQLNIQLKIVISWSCLQLRPQEDDNPTQHQNQLSQQPPRAVNASP